VISFRADEKHETNNVIGKLVVEVIPEDKARL
jgi:hypothetical protein